MKLTTSFNRGFVTEVGGRPLSYMDLQEHTPSVFATLPHGSRSEKYTHISTADIIHRLRTEGWEPHYAVQARPRDWSKMGFAKHMLRFRRMHQIQRIRDATPEVVLVNSHDGSSAYQLVAGLIRHICLNKLIAGDGFLDVRIPHMGNIMEQVIAGVDFIEHNFEEMAAVVTRMRETELSEVQRNLFAAKVIKLRYGDTDSPISIQQLLETRRFEPNISSVWMTLNVVQENLMKGGLYGSRVDSNGKRRSQRTRPIRGIAQNVSLNRDIWDLAMEFNALIDRRL